MARKQRQLSDENVLPHARFVSLFRKSRQGREILAEMEVAARLEESRLDRRNAAYDALREADRIEREELPELEAEQRNAGGEYHRIVPPAAKRVNTARLAVERKRREIAAIRNQARRELMDTNEDGVRDAADVRHAIIRDTEHLAKHGVGVELPQLQQQLIDTRKMRGGKLLREEDFILERQVKQAEAAAAVGAKLRDAADRLRDIEIVTVDDVQALITEVTADLPKVCPFCPDSFGLHKAAAQVALKAGEE